MAACAGEDGEIGGAADVYGLDARGAAIDVGADEVVGDVFVARFHVEGGFLWVA